MRFKKVKSKRPICCDKPMRSRWVWWSHGRKSKPTIIYQCARCKRKQ